MRKKLKLKVNKNIFNKIYYKRGLNNQATTQLYYGGSSSGKSYFLAQRTVLDVLRGRNYLIVRQTNSSIKKSVWNEVTKAISNMKVAKFFKVNKSDQTITCVLNKKQMLFTGLDDVEKVKSVTPVDGVVTDIWIEEATQISKTSYKQLTKRLRGKSKHKKRITLSFNPILREHWLYRDFFLYNWLFQESTFESLGQQEQWFGSDELTILKTTYKDNKFLTADDIYNLENEDDKYYLNVYTLGNFGVLGNLIFKNWSIEEFDSKHFDNIRNGLDWGFGSDPFAFIRVHLDKKRKTLYIFDEVYSTGLSDEEAMKIVIKKINRNELITADSSEPKSISLWRSKKFNIRGAKKGAGSIETGIKNIQALKVIINPRCKNTIAEFSKYKWKENKAGDVLPIPVDKDNHLIDALRYALENDIITRNRTSGSKPRGF